MEESRKRLFLQNLETLEEFQLHWIIEKEKYSEWQKEQAQKELKNRRKSNDE